MSETRETTPADVAYSHLIDLHDELGELMTAEHPDRNAIRMKALDIYNAARDWALLSAPTS